MGILVFILVSYGISNIVVHGSIFNGLESFGKKLVQISSVHYSVV